MKKVLLLLVAAVLLAGSWSTSARAEAGELSGEVGVDYASRYIWRGLDLIEDNNPAIQPWATVGYGLTDKLSISYLFWADYRLVSGSDREGDDAENDWDEFDHVVTLTYEMDDTWSFDLGYIYYSLPSVSGSNAEEVYGGATMALPYNLSTSLYVYYQFDSGNPYGTYTKWTVDYSRALTEFAEVSASVGLGYMHYNRTYGGEDFDSGLSDLPLSMGLSFDLGKGVSAKISANYSFSLDALEDNQFEPGGSDYNDKDEAWLMTGLSYSF